MKGKCAILVDLQGDFTEFMDGALKVPGTDKDYVERVREAVEILRKKGIPVVATKDWHPQDHISFFTNHPGTKPFEEIDLGGRRQKLWPPHCIQGTVGASLLIPESLFNKVVEKGKDRRYDSYSGFVDDGGNETGLEEILREIGAKELIVFGLATDYCVIATIRDAVKRGYKVTFIEGLSRGVEKSTVELTLSEMESLGVSRVKDLKEVLE